jgi:hypothetical protein
MNLAALHSGSGFLLSNSWRSMARPIEPTSVHGTCRTWRDVRLESAFGDIAEVAPKEVSERALLVAFRGLTLDGSV